MKTPALPILDARGAIVGWKPAPRRVLVRPTVLMQEHPLPAGDVFAPGMLLRVAETDEFGVMFEVLFEGTRD